MEVCGQLHAPAAFKEAAVCWIKKNDFILAGSRTPDRPVFSLLTAGNLLSSCSPVIYLSNQTTAVWITSVSDWNMRKVTKGWKSSMLEGNGVGGGQWNLGVSLPPYLSLTHTHTIAVRVAKSEQCCDSAASYRWPTHILVFSTPLRSS